MMPKSLPGNLPMPLNKNVGYIVDMCRERMCQHRPLHILMASSLISLLLRSIIYLAPFKKFQSYTTYDCLVSEAIPYTIQRSEDCAICGEKALLALGDIEPIPDYLKRQKEPIAIPSPPDITALSEAETTNECATQSLDKWR